MFLAPFSALSHQILGSDVKLDDPNIEILLDASIDELRIRHVRSPNSECKSGFYDHLEILGEIGPDSTAAIEKILPQLDVCEEAEGTQIVNAVYLSSDGGYVFDGYALGNLFKEYSMETIVTSGQYCASSCAVAFLGGEFRTMDSDAELMFHAPYYSDTGTDTDTPECVGRREISELRRYYQIALGRKNGNHLLKRTLDYCSTWDGWIINADAAKIFGITTD